MNKEEFYQFYANNSGIPVSNVKHLLDAIPCDCEEKDCQGWQMVKKERKKESEENK